MAATANHHYVPQMYLRNFAEGVKRQAKLFVIDSIDKKSFSTLVRNVGAKRYFNKIEANGFEGDFLEKEFSKIEAKISSHLNEVILSHSFPSQEHYDSIINFMALLSVRNPKRRQIISNAHSDISQRMIELVLDDKERWEATMKDMNDKGIHTNKDTSYEEMKKFIENGEYDIKINQNYLIAQELDLVDPVLKTLAKRNWCFIHSADGYDFITSDDPVVLSWADGITSNSPYSAGHGLKNTMIFFPLCPKLALLGQFESIPKSIQYTRHQTINANTHIAHHSNRQIYAKNNLFRINLLNSNDVAGHEVQDIISKI